MRGRIVAALVGASGLACSSPPPPPGAAETACTATAHCPAGLECLRSTCVVPGAYAAAELARLAAANDQARAARAGERVAHSNELARLTTRHFALVAIQRPLELEKQRIDARLRAATGEERSRLRSELFALDVRLAELEEFSEVGPIVRRERMERELQACKGTLAAGGLRAEEHMRLTDLQATLERDLAAAP